MSRRLDDPTRKARLLAAYVTRSRGDLLRLLGNNVITLDEARSLNGWMKRVQTRVELEVEIAKKWSPKK